MYFNNNIHHDNCIPVVQADVKAVSRSFPALGLGLACETMPFCEGLAVHVHTICTH